MADAISTAKVEMPAAERLLLFSLVRALRPTRVLQVGVGEGGVATIVAAALDDVGGGTLVCVDPAPRVSDTDWTRIAHRVTLLSGDLADVVDEVRAVAGGFVDLAFVAAERAEVGRALEATSRLLGEGAYLLLQGALDADGARAVDALVARGRRFVDCGALSAARDAGALRLLRHVARPTVAARGSHDGGFRTDELAAILAETTQLDAASAERAARGLVDPLAYPIDYVAECKALWVESPDDFVAGLYRILLSREADPSGAGYYVGRLKLGDSRLDVVRMLASSEEAREKGLRTDWIDQLVRTSPTFPVGMTWANGTWNRLRSWIRRQPALARAARYAMVAGRTPWTIERLHALVAEQQQMLEQQRRQIQRLERQVGQDADGEDAPAIGERLAALSGEVAVQNRMLVRLTDAVDRVLRELAARR
jgi:predicted O-methyltransferase YrrM